MSSHARCAGFALAGLFCGCAPGLQGSRSGPGAPPTRILVSDTLASLPRCRVEYAPSQRVHVTVWPDRLLPAAGARWLIFRGRPNAGQRLQESDFPTERPCHKAQECATWLPIPISMRAGEPVTICLCIRDEGGQLCPDPQHDLTCAACVWP